MQNALLDSRKWESELTKEMQRYCDRAVGRLETCSVYESRAQGGVSGSWLSALLNTHMQAWSNQVLYLS